MKKQELINRLGDYSYSGNSNRKGEKTFVSFLIGYLGGLCIPGDEKYVFYDIVPHIPQILTDAHHEFRTSTEHWVSQLREQYVQEIGRNVANLTDVGVDNDLYRFSEVLMISSLAKKVLGKEDQGDYVEQDVLAHSNAQANLLQQVFDNFLRKVYRKGMFEMINSSKICGIGGVFGQTELRTFVTAGRIMFTFARGVEGSEEEISISFVAEDGDPNGYSAGLQSIHAGLVDSFTMINDVTDNWPEDEEKQKEVFLENDTISMT